MFHIARMVTRHFTFEAGGWSEAEAKRALLAGWRRHLSAAIASYSDHQDTSEMEAGLKMSLKQLQKEYELSVTALKAGDCLRDGDKI